MPIPTASIGDYIDAYDETVPKLRDRANNQPFADTLQKLIETHLSQMRLLGRLAGVASANTESMEADVSIEDRLGEYRELVESLSPTTFQERNWTRNRTSLDRALFVLIKTQLFQLGIFGGFQIPDDRVAPAAEANLEDADVGDGGEDLKRCPDGSLVPHGLGCP